MARLNRECALGDPEEDNDGRVSSAGDYKLHAEFTDQVVIEEFDTGPL